MLGKFKRLSHAGLGIACAAFFLYLSLRKIDPAEFWERLKSVDLRFFAPILLMLALFYWLKAIRWSYLLAPLRPLTVRQVFPAQMIGFMGNNVLPAHLGEFLRMYVLGKQYELSKTAVLSTIVLERVLDFLAIIGIFAITLQFLPDLGPDSRDNLELVRKGGYAIGIACLVVFLVFLGFVWKTDLALRLTEGAFGIFPATLRAKLIKMVRLGVAGLYSLKNPRTLIVLIVLTFVHWTVNGFTHYMAAVSFPPDNRLPWSAAFLLLSVTALGVTLPSAPGYVGTIQLCFVVTLSVYGMGRETALAASLYTLVMGWVPVTLLGFYFLARLGLKLTALSHAADSEESAGPP